MIDLQSPETQNLYVEYGLPPLFLLDWLFDLMTVRQAHNCAKLVGQGLWIYNIWF